MRHPFLSHRLRAGAAPDPKDLGLRPTRNYDGFETTVDGHHVVIRVTEPSPRVRREIGLPSRVVFETLIDGAEEGVEFSAAAAVIDLRARLRELRRPS